MGPIQGLLKKENKTAFGLDARYNNLKIVPFLFVEEK